jgi:hypothetical protein
MAKSRTASQTSTSKSWLISARFQDARNWTRKFKGWFFYKEGQEKGFKIADVSQIDCAIKLITQSYKLAK